MSWFQLDPGNVADRVRARGGPVSLPGLGASLSRGIVGLTVLSIAGFAPWAFMGRWFYRNTGEGGLYAACALVFIGLSGPLLHRLILGPGSLVRFYKIFGVTFIAYSVLWTAGWMSLGGDSGSLTGLLAGTAAMGWMLARAFGARGNTIRIIAALFALNSIGYFVGGWVEGAVIRADPFSLLGETLSKPAQRTLGKLLWGVCYGLGFGAGLGLAFYWCQHQTREALRSFNAEPPPQTEPQPKTTSTT